MKLFFDKPSKLFSSNEDREMKRRLNTYHAKCPGLLSFISISALIAGLVVLINPTKILSSVFISVSEDTEYALGYSERKFKLVKIGDTEASVQRALGVPISESSTKPYFRWLYSSKPMPEFEVNGNYPNNRYSFTTIEFGDDGIFVNAFGRIAGKGNTGFFSISSSSSFSDGVNPLVLTREDIERLKAKKATPEQVERTFGKPQAVFKSQVIKWLQYSHSPGSKNYRTRSIGIDQQGKVSRKVSKIYWD